MVLLFLNLNEQTGSIQLAFFAPFMLLLAYLMFKSTFLPRALAAPIALAAVGWLTFLWPPLAAALMSYVEPLGFIAEAALMLWLLAMGVNSERWRQQVSQ